MSLVVTQAAQVNRRKLSWGDLATGDTFRISLDEDADDYLMLTTRDCVCITTGWLHHWNEKYALSGKSVYRTRMKATVQVLT